MARLTDFMDDVMPRVPGAEEPLVEHEIFAAIRTFCEDGLAWPEILTFNVVADKRRYYLDPQRENTRVGYILGVLFAPDSYLRRWLPPIAENPRAIYRTQNTSPAGYYMEAPNVMQLVPIPSTDEERGLDITATLIPTDKTCNIPNMFTTHYRDAIIDGSVFRLTSMVSKPWSDQVAARYHGRSFRNHIKRTRDNTRKRWAGAEGNWLYPFFAGTRPGLVLR